MPAIATWKALSGKLDWANQEYERFTGKTRDEAISYTPRENWPGEVGEAIMAHDTAVRENLIPEFTVDRIPKGGGELHRVNLRFPICDEAGQLQNTASRVPPLLAGEEDRQTRRAWTVARIKQSARIRQLSAVRRGRAADSRCEFVAHYHAERNHQGIGNLLIFPDPDLTGRDGAVRRRSRLGGMLNYYDRAA